MLHRVKWIAPAVALAVLLSFTASRSIAEEAKKGTGSLAGVVMDQAGKAVSGVEVRLYNQMPKKEKQGAAGAQNQSSGEQSARDLAEKPAKADKPVPLANATTDGDGKFTMADVPVGDYTVIAQQKGVGNARQNVTVKAGEVSKVELKFKPKKDAPKPAEK